MPAAFFQATLDFGATLLTSAADCILDTEWVKEQWPSLHRTVQKFIDLEAIAQRKITLLVLAYATVALLAWHFLRESPRKRKGRAWKKRIILPAR